MRRASSPLVVVALTAGAAVLTSLGGTIGGSLTYDYGFSVEAMADSPCWQPSDLDLGAGGLSGSRWPGDPGPPIASGKQADRLPLAPEQLRHRSSRPTGAPGVNQQQGAITMPPARSHRRSGVASKATVALGLAALALAPAAAHAQVDDGAFAVHVYSDRLSPVADNPPAHGFASLVRVSETVRVVVVAFGLSPDLPHVMHIHGHLDAANECPDASADANGDGLVDTVEGVPAYGPIQTTFTTTGGTSGAFGPDSLDLGRAPMANQAGVMVYRRTLPVMDTVGPGQFGIPRNIADNLSAFHIVIHGADLNDNGAYDFGPGTSSLSAVVGAPVPLEAELPVACGRIQG